MPENDHPDHIYVVRLPLIRKWTTDYALAYEMATGRSLDDTDDDLDDAAEDRISIMHTRGSEYVLDLSKEEEYQRLTCLNRTYACGHVAYGPPRELPTECPECGDSIARPPTTGSTTNEVPADG